MSPDSLTGGALRAERLLVLDERTALGAEQLVARDGRRVGLRRHPPPAHSQRLPSPGCAALSPPRRERRRRRWPVELCMAAAPRR
eukprot:scaffold244763_cov30-Tisochrysis_lutea.AAC.7